MKMIRPWSVGLVAVVCLLFSAAAFAQDEKDPAALWADFTAAIKQGQTEPARQAAANILGSRRLDDRHLAELIDKDPDHDAVFLQGIQDEKTRDATARVLEGYISFKARPKIAQQWVDFNHYVRIARPDAAQTAGNNVLGQLEPAVTEVLPKGVAEAGGAPLLKRLEEQTLLDVVESSEYPDMDQTLLRAERSPTLKDIADKIAARVQEARIDRSRDRERILADIQHLAEGERANVNAVLRLKAAGQYAAPELLNALLDEKRARLQPFVLAAMVSVGRPMVYPLSIALPNLEPLPQGQVAQVLAEIGYPRALPYLRMVLENPKTDANTRILVDAAYKQLARVQPLPEKVSAAGLFLTLAENFYTAGSTGDLALGFESAGGKGVVWEYDRDAGLIDIRVPAAIFPDVMAMRAARQALALNPRLDPALSIWLMATQRRANRLPPGETDPSYPANLQSPAFYMEMAGPLRQHDVLHRALADGDTMLALDAIKALGQTAGTEALVNRAGLVQPLLLALSYPDRRVRFAAAFALTNARPRSEFPGSFRVVPVLAEAVRQSDVRYAVVLGQDQESLNRLAAIVTDLGYKPIGGLALRDVAEQVSAGPGVDLIVTNQGTEQVVDIYRQSAQDYKLAAIPIVALVSPGAQIELTRRFDRDPRLRPTTISDDPKQLRAALEGAAKAYAGAAITPEEAQKYAVTSLQLLQQIATSSRNVFHVAEAEPALLQAIRDKRQPVSLAAATVLALLESPEAQMAIADAALDTTKPPEVRIQLLNTLADSATRYGNHLNEVQLNSVLTMTKTAQGDLALAAARLHGALTLPTEDVVQLIEK